jgi:nitroreductase
MVIDPARWAPSGANTQPWEFIVVRNRNIKNRLLDHVSGRIDVSGLRDTPVLIVVCGDTRTRLLYPSGRYLAEIDKIMSDENHIELKENVLTSSLANAFLYILLAAKTLGLGARYISATSNPAIQREIKKLLKMPGYLVIYDTIALGYPEDEPLPKMVRPLSEILHYEEFDASTSPTSGDIVRKTNELRKRLEKRR